MTIKTFWTIFIKILGIWLALDSLSVIPQFISTLFYIGPGGTMKNIALNLALLLLVIGVYIFISQLFIFKTVWLINKLHLDKGFTEEKINLNMQLTDVLTVATIVIGGLIFAESLPQLCKQIFVFSQQRNVFKESPTSGWIIFYLVKVVLGYLLMTNSKLIAAYINKQKVRQNDDFAE